MYNLQTVKLNLRTILYIKESLKLTQIYFYISRKYFTQDYIDNINFYKKFFKWNFLGIYLV